MICNNLSILSGTRIKTKLLKGYSFSPAEINDINSRFCAQTSYNKIEDWLRRGSDREKLLADIYYAVESNNLERINDIMSGNVEKLTDKDIHLIRILGLLQT